MTKKTEAELEADILAAAKLVAGVWEQHCEEWLEWGMLDTDLYRSLESLRLVCRAASTLDSPVEEVEIE